jgi:hypothetical protein
MPRIAGSDRAVCDADFVGRVVWDPVAAGVWDRIDVGSPEVEGVALGVAEAR